MSRTVVRAKGPGVWTGNSLGSKEVVCFDLEKRHLDCLTAVLQSIRSKNLCIDSIDRDAINLSAIREELGVLNKTLHQGRGLLVVRGFPIDQFDLSELEVLFWCFGSQFGEPVSQSVLGDRLGHVIDVTDKDPNARGYRNSRELTLHTDLADCVSFMCIRKARAGGVSWFSSALTVHNEILETRPDLLNYLYKGYYWYRSGEHAENSSPVTPWRVPLFSEVDGWVSCRYVREYILEAGLREGGQVLSEKELEAINFFDAISHRDGIPIKFLLEPGEAVFINNLTVLHARTRFENFTDPACKRLLLRLWMTSASARPTKPELQIFDGDNEQGIPPQPGRTPSWVRHAPPQEMPGGQ